MALLMKNDDGTYASRCPVCNKRLTKPFICIGFLPKLFTPFSRDIIMDLWKYEDSAMHWDCYARSPIQPWIAAQFFKDKCDSTERDDYLTFKLKTQPWLVLLKKDNLLVRCLTKENMRFRPDLSKGQISVVLGHTGSELIVNRDKWRTWINGAWRESCRHPLEITAMEEAIADLKSIIIPEKAKTRQKK